MSLFIAALGEKVHPELIEGRDSPQDAGSVATARYQGVPIRIVKISQFAAKRADFKFEYLIGANRLCRYCEL